MWASNASAQTLSAGSDLVFYGDNTEFANPFRDGETTLGASGHVFLEFGFGESARLRAGFFGLNRFASRRFLEHAEPMVALEIGSHRSRFIFGALQTTGAAHDVEGPDRETPHALLPPLQQETLTFTRGQETGLQWLVDTPLVDHDIWLNWQRLNTASARERFDAGYRGGLRLASRLRLLGQWHLVHEGGQQFASGAVRDSQAVAMGLAFESPRYRGRGFAPAPTPGGTGHPRQGVRVKLDAHAVLTEFVPDRERLERREVGLGVFARGALHLGDWRAHLIVWRGRDALKEEGDANYLALRTDGSIEHKVRDYSEVGVTRRFEPAPGIAVLAAVRVHRVEADYQYSYRIVGRVRLRQRFR